MTPENHVPRRRIDWPRKVREDGSKEKFIRCPKCGSRWAPDMRPRPGDSGELLCQYVRQAGGARCLTKLLVIDIVGHHELLVAEVSDADLAHMEAQRFEGAAQVVYLLRNPVRVASAA